MQDLIARIGIPLFIQVVIEIWNGLFLLIMIFTLTRGIRRNTDSAHAAVKVPLTREILIFYIAIFFYNLMNVLGILPSNSAGRLSYWMVRIAAFLYYVIGAFQTLFFLQLIKKHVAEKHELSLLKRATTILQVLNIPPLLLLCFTPLTGSLYYFNERNEYFRGPLFFTWHMVTIILFVYIFAVCLLFRNQIDRFLRQVIFTSVLIPMCGFVLNTNYSGISFNNISVSVSALIIFLFYEQHRTEVAVQSAHQLDQAQMLLAEKQLALEQSKNEVLMAQIQPHFINNSLMALRSRCREDPDLYESITNFSRYLRSHFDGLSDTKMITFEQEMENVEAYLELERLNFEDRLAVEYDIDADDFLVPALSVQPLVENAVRHGIGTYEMGGTVRISAHRADGRICIEIIDDGSGKSSLTQRQEKRKGIGIENVRARLQSMQNAKLEILRGDHGTTARILIDEEGGAQQ